LKKITTNLVPLWHWLNGSVQVFSLDTRIFHSVCIISILALLYNIPLNYYVGLPIIAIASAASLFLIAGVYYLSRFYNRIWAAKMIFCSACVILFVLNYFLNSGINGPTDIFFIMTMIMMVAIVPVRQYWFWVTLNIAIVLGLHYLQFLHPDLVPNTYEHIQNRYLDVSSAYVTVVAVCLFNFYSIRRSYEAEKKSAEQKTQIMKLMNEEKNKLFSIISHDLRSPLSNIQSYLELLTEGAISEGERIAFEKTLLEATKSTVDLLNNVLNWSRSQMDGLKFKLEPLNVYQLLSPQLLLFINIAVNKKIKFDVSIDPTIEVLGNSDMLQLVVRNLVNNAIKFTGPGGKIMVTAETVDRLCIITVKDSGTGNAVDLSQNIFYLNAPPSVGTANEKGIGLGLVLCKEYTEAQNGKISFECDPISGTTFRVELPSVTHVVTDTGEVKKQGTVIEYGLNDLPLVPNKGI
jgi:two-component system sensor histidine kinase/response regulator